MITLTLKYLKNQGACFPGIVRFQASFPWKCLLNRPVSVAEIVKGKNNSDDLNWLYVAIIQELKFSDGFDRDQFRGIVYDSLKEDFKHDQVALDIILRDQDVAKRFPMIVFTRLAWHLDDVNFGDINYCGSKVIRKLLANVLFKLNDVYHLELK